MRKVRLEMQFLSMLIFVPLAAIGILAGGCSVLYFGKIAVAAIADPEFRDIKWYSRWLLAFGATGSTVIGAFMLTAGVWYFSSIFGIM